MHCMCSVTSIWLLAINICEEANWRCRIQIIRSKLVGTYNLVLIIYLSKKPLVVGRFIFGF